MNRTNKTGAQGPADAAEKVQESAQQIWLAGLGAFAKAQAEGGKVFEALVRDGLSLQRQTQATAEEKIAEATERLSSLAGGLTAGLPAPPSQPWDRLGTIFEDRVAKAMAKLGVPSQAEWAQLTARLEALEARLPAAPAPKQPSNPKRPAPRPAAKTTPRPAVKRGTAPRG